MPPRLSTDEVSGMQSDLLMRVKRYRSYPPSFLVDTFMEIIDDEDIKDGDESLHPDWLEIYQKTKERISKYADPETREKIRSFFDSLSPFDSGLELVDPKKEKVVFLLGAGASKPEPSGIPTVKDLLPDMLMRARRLDREEITRLATFCDKENMDNIEDLLTAVQLSAFCGRNPYILRLVDFLLFKSYDSEDPRYRMRRRSPVDVSSVAFIQDTLQVLFGLLSSRMLPADPNPGHTAIADFAQTHPTASIVTTNYDCCVDLALSRGDIPLSYLIEFSNTPEVEQKSESPIKLIKLHGSLNWFYCETCQQIHLMDIETFVTEYKEYKSFYPVIAVCKDCGGQLRGLLVPPLAMKFDILPPLNTLLDQAAEAFDQSDLIVVVGFSFADADLYISRMLSKAMQTTEHIKLLIFDPDQSLSQKVRLKLSTRIPNFDTSRILASRGDCAETLPKFLKGSLMKEVAEPKQIRSRRKS